ncbi:hypothetical protein CCYA_CCYA14G3701 [Cyanidiococcus yangmingshanensis]|nr:hypothetical protein CCYA_CCYA14G3701 [Cyanidiococcus yangmingshanensis]
MDFDLQTFSSAERKAVGAVQFGVLSPDETRRFSVVRVEYDVAFERGVPKAGGVMDPRLGAIDRNFPCATCEGSSIDCPGHFGHIELVKPVFNILMIGTVLKTLRCVCFYCSRLLVDRSDTRMQRVAKIRDPVKRFQAVFQLCNGTRVCGGGGDGTDDDLLAPAALLAAKQSLPKPREGCGNLQPKISRDGIRIMAEFPDAEAFAAERKQELSAERVQQILRHIRDEDIEFLGFHPRFARPDWMILGVLPVPPPHVRPSIQMDAVSRGEDDLTFKLGDIIKANNALRRLEAEGAPAHVIREQLVLLQFHVATLMNNDLPGMPRATLKSGRPLKSIAQRLKGKEGRVRNNLMGKRVNFSARTVITADPQLALDEVGVPRSVAMTLTYPEVVTPFNIDRLWTAVRNGPNAYPGALFVIRNDSKRIALQFVRRSADIMLEPGCVVERHLLNGDLVLFNRQPSLHRMSIMGHRVRVLPYSTFRMNLSATSPYNADFDGDEMNLHVPQSEEVRAEIQELMAVPKNIVSPQANRPVMGIVQDSLLGCMLFTLRDNFLDEDTVFNLLLHLPHFDGRIPAPAILKPHPLWTGKQIFSLLLPDGVNLERFSNGHPDHERTIMTPSDTRVLIQNGELVTGTVDKRTVGSSAGSLIHVTWKEAGPERTSQLISDIQLLINYWLMQNGMSIGIGDCIADANTMAAINRTIQEAKDEVRQLIRLAQEGRLERQPGKTMLESFEACVNRVLNSARDKAGGFAQESLLPSNNIKRMVSAGSKGSFINVSQIVACVGQQNVEGKRIPYGFRRRTLPHFVVDDLSPEARGFVENSYLRGLTPEEVFFHAMGGREGLIDTAVKTAETGYIQRRLMKAMEDIRVEYDGTVRNSLGDVLQFLYGDDSAEGSMLEVQELRLVRASNQEMESIFRLDVYDRGFGVGYLEPDVIDTVRTDPEIGIELEEEYQQLLADREQLFAIFPTGENKWPLMVNVQRLIVNCKSIFGIQSDGLSDLHPRQVIEGVRALLARCIVVLGDDELSQEAQRNATLLFSAHVRAELATKRVLQVHRLHSKALTWLLGEIETRFVRARATPGEMVGAVAAQSLGEPATQMTLNTFHFAGVSAKNVTLGVPRLKELINVAKQAKTPSVTVYLKNGKDKELANIVQSELEQCRLRDVVESSAIFFDPDPANTVIEEDREWVRDYFDLPDEMDRPERLSPWLLRIVLSTEMMIDKRLRLSDVARKLRAEFGGDLSVVYSDDNAEKLVMHIRMAGDEYEKGALGMAGLVDGIHADDSLNLLGPGDMSGTLTSVGLNGMRDLGDQEASALDEQDDVFLKRIELALLEDMQLKGMAGIRKVFMRQTQRMEFDPQSGSFVSNPEWVLDTEGTALLAVLSHPDVDSRRTISNEVTEVLEVLGIEAARQALYNEMYAVLSFDGSSVGYRHLALLAEVMTCRGYIIPISRFGINRLETGPLMRCTFEETVEVLATAATFGIRDQCEGVSQAVILGQRAAVGTGAFSLSLDETLLSQTAADISVMGNVTTASMMAGGMSPDADAWTPAYTPGATPALSSDGGAAPWTPSLGVAMASPYGAFSPAVGFSPAWSVHGSGESGKELTGYGAISATPYATLIAGGTSPAWAPSPAIGAIDGVAGTFSPSSPAYSPTSPRLVSPSSPAYSPTSPAYSPTSPAYSPSSPNVAYSPSSPVAYSPSSPNVAYSPSSPVAYSPSSPNVAYSPSSPVAYSPSSPNVAYSPSSPVAYSPSSPNVAYSPSSPVAYSPSSPNVAYSPSSPVAYSPSSPNVAYSPSSPNVAYSPSSPAFSPSSPVYSPKSK